MLLDQFQSTASDVAIEGQLASIVGDQGVRVVDVSDPADPQEVGSLSPQSGVSIAMSGGSAFVLGSAELSAVDLTAPWNPALIGTTALPGSGYRLAVSGSHAFVAAGIAGLRVADVADPATPTLVGYSTMPGSAHDVAVDAGHAFIAGSDGSLRVIDVSTPSDPREVAYHYIIGGAADAVVVTDGHAYVGSGQWITVFDISVPSDPIEVGFLRLSARDIRDLAVSGNRLFAATYLSSGTPVGNLIVVNISDPTNPVEDSSIGLEHELRSITLHDSVAWVAAGAEGLLSFDLKCAQDSLFADGFDSGTTSEWSSASP